MTRITLVSMLLLMGNALFSFGQSANEPMTSYENEPDFVFHVDNEGNKYISFMHLALKHADLLGLSFDDRIQLEKKSRQLGNETYAQVTKLVYPEIDSPSPFDDDLIAKVHGLKLSDTERASRNASQQVVLKGLLPSRARDEQTGVYLSVDRSQSLLLRELAIQGIRQNCSLEQILRGASESDKLSLSAEERDEFIRTAKEIDRELKLEVLRLQKEAFEKILATLPLEERRKMERFLLLDLPKSK